MASMGDPIMTGVLALGIIVILILLLAILVALAALARNLR